MAGVLELLEQAANQIVSIIPYSRLKIWKQMIFHPYETIRAEKNKPSLRNAAMDVAAASLVLAAELVIIYLISGTYSNLVYAGKPAMLIPLVALTSIAFYLTVWLVWSATQYLSAKALGAKASFKQYASLLGLAFAAFLVLDWFLTPALHFLPENARSFVDGIIGVYLPFLSFILIRELYGFSNLRTTAVLFLSFLLTFIIVLVAIFLLNFLTNGLVLQLISSSRQAPI
jgi:hypothetical protein